MAVIYRCEECFARLKEWGPHHDARGQYCHPVDPTPVAKIVMGLFAVAFVVLLIGILLKWS